jgi:hypothetical protein
MQSQITRGFNPLWDASSTQARQHQTRFQGTLQRTEPSPNEPNATSHPDPKAYETPRPQQWLINLLNPVNNYIVLKGIPLLKDIPGLNQIRGLTGLVQVEKLDFPKADQERFKAAVNPDTIAFIGPNHPEFFTDWTLDKKLASKTAPQMAFWADAGMVNLSPLSKKFCLANNLIANNGREKAKEDSIRIASEGKGVLLHPEGRVWWQGDKVHDLFPGIVDMSLAAAQQEKGSEKPVYLLPVVWKFQFNGDVSKGLQAEMTELEKKLGGPVRNDLPLEKRFFQLHEDLLNQQEKKFGLPEGNETKPYFQRQQRLQQFLTEKLEAQYGYQPADTTEAKLLALEKAVSKAAKANPAADLKNDNAMLKELFRLEGFSPEVYNKPYLTQEHLYENLKRSRQILFPGSDTMIPKPAGERTAHIRVAEPIDIRAQLRTNPDGQAQLAKTLLKQTQAALQAKLDEVNREIEPETRNYRVQNAFYTLTPQIPVKAHL